MSRNVFAVALLGLLSVEGLVACEDVTAIEFGDCLIEPCAGDACRDLIKPGWCYVDGQCYQPGQSPPGLLCEKVCDPERIAFEFVKPCPNGSSCSGANVCGPPMRDVVGQEDGLETDDGPGSLSDADPGPDAPSGDGAGPGDGSNPAPECENHPAFGQSCGGDDPCESGTWGCDDDGLLTCVSANKDDSPELCDGVDNDCDGLTDEDFPGLGLGCDGPDADQCANGVLVCNDGEDGTVCLESSDGTNAGELCDGLDNDCDGLTDEDFPTVGDPCDSADSDECVNGTVVCATDGAGVTCQETQTNIAEVCDGLDNDCDGQTDEDFQTLGNQCDSSDSDQCANGTLVCATGGAGVTCQETQTNIAEVCDGLDNDCDGLTDEDFPTVGNSCDSSDSDQCVNGTLVCAAGGAGVTCQETQTNIAEVCDGLDNDCDGQTDENIAGCCTSDAQCADGDKCNGTEYCDNGTCKNGTPVVCSGGDTCTGVEACVDGVCVKGDPLDCSDGIACTVDTCELDVCFGPTTPYLCYCKHDDSGCGTPP